MILERKKWKGRFVNIYETEQIILGFTETHFPFKSFARRFIDYQLTELEQVHSDILLFSNQAGPGSEGDGIILEEAGRGAVIKTADCTPLFFWFQQDNGGVGGGVLHIGWRGLLKGIELKLLTLLEEKFSPFDYRRLYVFLGPAIEKKCYEVGADLYEAFSTKNYRDKIFYPVSTPAESPGSRKYLLDVRQGIRLSLQKAGLPAEQVEESPLCTFCEADRFPSYRRSPNSGRIYNFLILKSPGHNVDFPN
jgi:YfiH family protein